MDDNIHDTVQSILGADVKIIDCEKSTTATQQEVLLINGVPVQLDGIADNDVEAIKTALMGGQVPSVELLNQMLYKAGISQQAVELETTVSVKSSLTTTEKVSVSRQGRVLDERMCKTEEDSILECHSIERLEPVQHKSLKKLPKPLAAIEGAAATQSQGSPLQKSATYTADVNALKSASTNSVDDSPTGSATASSTTITRGRESNLSYDSGYDGVFNSGSQCVSGGGAHKSQNTKSA